MWHSLKGCWNFNFLEKMAKELSTYPKAGWRRKGTSTGWRPRQRCRGFWPLSSRAWSERPSRQPSGDPRSCCPRSSPTCRWRSCSGGRGIPEKNSFLEWGWVRVRWAGCWPCSATPRRHLLPLLLCALSAWLRSRPPSSSWPRWIGTWSVWWPRGRCESTREGWWAEGCRRTRMQRRARILSVSSPCTRRDPGWAAPSSRWGGRWRWPWTAARWRRWCRQRGARSWWWTVVTAASRRCTGLWRWRRGRRWKPCSTVRRWRPRCRTALGQTAIPESRTADTTVRKRTWICLTWVSSLVTEYFGHTHRK